MHITETVLSSSILITAIVLFRAIFKKKIPAGFTYGLWLLAALRLLCPFIIWESPVSVINLVELKQDQPVTEPEAPDYSHGVGYRELYTLPSEGLSTKEETAFLSQTSENLQKESSDFKGIRKTVNGYSNQQKPGSGNRLFRQIKEHGMMIWLTGMIGTFMIFLFQNAVIGRYLFRTRRLLDLEGGGKLKVYSAGNRLASPCLFGIIPAIYIPEGILNDEENKAGLSSILKHEYTHYKHLDHLWSVIRLVCLSLYWYNPFVWAAGYFAVRDSELFCDDSCIAGFNQEERIRYGETLLCLLNRAEKPGSFCNDTAIISPGKDFIKQRMELIAGINKRIRGALLITLIFSTVCVGCTFTGAVSEKETAKADQEYMGIQEAIKPVQNARTPVADREQKEKRHHILFSIGDKDKETALFLISSPILEETNKVSKEPVRFIIIPSDLQLINKKNIPVPLNDVLKDGKDGELKDLIERNMEIPIEEVITWSYKELAGYVDALGSLQLDIKENEYSYLNGYQYALSDELNREPEEIVNEGNQLLNGLQTAAYMQIKYAKGGFNGLLRRQSSVMEELLTRLPEVFGKANKVESSEVFNSSSVMVCLESSSVTGKQNFLQMIPTDWEELMMVINAFLYPEQAYAPSEKIKEQGDLMLQYAEREMNSYKKDSSSAANQYMMYLGSNYDVIRMLSVNTGKDTDYEQVKAAWKKIQAAVSGRELITEKDRAVYQVGLVFDHAGDTGFPEVSDGKGESVEKFIYLVRKTDGWYVDGPLHNNLPDEEWWAGEEVPYESYVYGLSDKPLNSGFYTVDTQAQYDAFMIAAEETAIKHKKLPLDDVRLISVP